MRRYANTTQVSADQSRAEIEKTLSCYGATGFLYGWQDSRALLEFIYNGKRIRFLLDMPDRDDDEFRLTPTRGNLRSDGDAFRQWEQATRQRWRALALLIKAKLEGVASGIRVFEHEFLPNVVMPDGMTVAEHVMPVMEQAYLTGQTPRLLTTGM